MNAKRSRSASCTSPASPATPAIWPVLACSTPARGSPAEAQGQRAGLAGDGQARCSASKPVPLRESERPRRSWAADAAVRREARAVEQSQPLGVDAEWGEVLADSLRLPRPTSAPVPRPTATSRSSSSAVRLSLEVSMPETLDDASGGDGSVADGPRPSGGSAARRARRTTVTPRCQPAARRAAARRATAGSSAARRGPVLEAVVDRVTQRPDLALGRGRRASTPEVPGRSWRVSTASTPPGTVRTPAAAMASARLREVGWTGRRGADPAGQDDSARPVSRAPGRPPPTRIHVARSTAPSRGRRRLPRRSRSGARPRAATATTAAVVRSFAVDAGASGAVAPRGRRARRSVLSTVRQLSYGARSACEVAAQRAPMRPRSPAGWAGGGRPQRDPRPAARCGPGRGSEVGRAVASPQPQGQRAAERWSRGRGPGPARSQPAAEAPAGVAPEVVERGDGAVGRRVAESTGGATAAGPGLSGR